MTGERKRGRPSHPDILTPGEWRIAKAVRFGLTNRQIAERKGISVDAVKFHVANILLKLGMSRRLELASWAGMPVAGSGAEEEEAALPESAAIPGDVPFVPPGFTRLFPYIFAEDARGYLDFLGEGLGGELMDVHAAPDGIVRNAHIRFGDTTIMVSEAGGDWPATRGTFYLYVVDAEAAMARALSAGGEVVSPVGFRPYGERQGGVRDPRGNVWWLSQRLARGGY